MALVVSGFYQVEANVTSLERDKELENQAKLMEILELALVALVLVQEVMGRAKADMV